MEEVFRKYNDLWFKRTFNIPVASHNQPGRPSKLFGDSSKRTKRRITENIRSYLEDGVIVHATSIELRKIGKRDASYLL